MKHILILFIFLNVIFANQLHVRINDPIYEYLDRLSTQGVLPNYLNGTLPLPRDYIAEMLSSLVEKRNDLSVVDNKILDEFLAEYRHELKGEPYFQLLDEESTYHPFQSWPKIKTGMGDLLSYSAKQEEHHLVVYEKEKNIVFNDKFGTPHMPIFDVFFRKYIQ